MSNNDYQQYHLTLLNELLHKVKSTPPFDDDALMGEDAVFLSNLQALANNELSGEDFYLAGQQLVCRIVAGYPQFTPNVARDLFWFFGGDCLHYLADEEIARFQAIDDARQTEQPKLS